MAAVEIVIAGRAHGVEIRNVWHIESVLDNAQDAQDAITQIRTAMSTHLAGIMSNNVTYYGATYRNIDVATSPAITAEWASLTGVVSADNLPRDVQMLVTWRALTTTPNASRKFFPGVTEQVNNLDGRLHPTQFANLTAFANVFTDHNNGVGGADYKYVCMRKNPVTGLAEAHNPWEIALPRQYYGFLKRRRT